MKADPTGKPQPVWQGRIGTGLEPHARALNDSLPVDQRLWPEAVGLYFAYARSLHEAGVLDEDELRELSSGCQQLELALRQQRVKLQGEDVHEAIESELAYRAGSSAHKIHTGLSRNDQVATLLRMRVMRLCEEAVEGIRHLERAILWQAHRGRDQLVAAYTHLQPAQPVVLAHWWLAHAAALERDEARFGAARETADQMPLGAGAVAGSPLAYDRLDLASRLGFSRIASNSIDAVGDRDFALAYLQAGAQLGLHLSRLAEDLVLASSPGFGWFVPPDGFSTGSSLLPQKRNPDLFELIRGKAGRLIANAERLSLVLKGLPSSYQKDLQEDKEAVFDTADTLAVILAVLPDAIRALEIRPERLQQSLSPELTAADLADALIEGGLTFRDAHAAVGRLHAAAERAGVSPSELPLEARLEICPLLGDELLHTMGYQASVARRDRAPGTGPASIEGQIRQLEERLGIAGRAEGPATGNGPSGGGEDRSSPPGGAVTIRQATLEDVPGIAKTVADYVAQGLLLPRPLSEMYQSVREFYVGIHQGKVVACASLRFLWRNLGEIRTLAVLPSHRGMGLGAMLVQRILEEARNIRLPKVIALTREVGFFERCGFRTAEREKLPRKIWADCIRCPRRHACDETAVEFVLDPSRGETQEPPSWELPIPLAAGAEMSGQSA